MKALWIPILVVLSLVPVACDGDKKSPAEATDCTSGRPEAVPARVDAQACTGGKCSANFSLPGAIGISRAVWEFTGADQAQYAQMSGTVTWTAPANPVAFEKPWSLKACGCRFEADIDERTCRTLSGVVKWGAGGIPSVYVITSDSAGSPVALFP